MENTRKVALVVGAAGVIGRNLAEHLAAMPEWDVIGVARRAMAPSKRIRYVSADLLDAADTRAKLGSLSQVTHVFYAAYQDRPTWAELVEPNVAMLRHVVEAVEAGSPGLRHVSLMQGYKVYGAHLGPFKTPAKESDARPLADEFNMAQQQLLEEKQRGKTWTWSALRPSVVTGFALGNPMNLAMVIAVYASISKELGLPLRFPGKPGAYGTLLEMTDAGLLARATVWAATEERAANQAFNITNGDLFRWNEMWPRIASFFGMEAAPPSSQPMSLEAEMADKEPVWNRIVEKHGLEPHAYREVSSWPFGDFVFSWDYDFLSDGSKARRLGFHDFVDTESMFEQIFEQLRLRRIIP
ncbi:SDR family oxidoreductase [Paenibacillus albicereus]|uniref:SDR family oxidoreductase n=1 Tax=Paenibacillus albicereus TaxID=2726185 RepID=A0A6H2H007_9BACL|nr:SDR family oxidoreductase [Paenibacillus albicereus]QJC53000.1 SDR family oxidoreductase [Paenibacillus albicereus]